MQASPTNASTTQDFKEDTHLDKMINIDGHLVRTGDLFDDAAAKDFHNKLKLLKTIPVPAMDPASTPEGPGGADVERLLFGQ